MRTLATLLTTAALALGTPAAAHAERWTSADPAGDAFSWDLASDEPCAPEAMTVTPDDHGSDLTRIRVAHSHGAVQLGATFGTAAGLTSRSVAFYVDTPGRAYVVEVSRYVEGGWPHQTTIAYAHPAPRWFATASCEEVFGGSGGDAEARRRAGCEELSAHYSGASVTVRVPRECLDTPRWVRVGAYAVTSDDDGDTIGFDTWLPAGKQPSGFLVGAVGPRVRPGR
jgi:hypothetical protein